jgi:hypothetical protein
MQQYKVWISVECCDEDEDEYEDQDLPELVGEFGDVETAYRIVEQLLRYANTLEVD